MQIYQELSTIQCVCACADFCKKTMQSRKLINNLQKRDSASREEDASKLNSSYSHMHKMSQEASMQRRHTNVFTEKI